MTSVVSRRLIRIDEDHFILELAPATMDAAKQAQDAFHSWYPGKKLLILWNGSHYVDQTGSYEVVPMPDSRRMANGKS